MFNVHGMLNLDLQEKLEGVFSRPGAQDYLAVLDQTQFLRFWPKVDRVASSAKRAPSSGRSPAAVLVQSWNSRCWVAARAAW